MTACERHARVSKEWEPADLFEVLADDTAREMLALASAQELAADEFADACGVSLPTVYRRVDALQEYDLLASETKIDTDGNNYETYETTLTEISITIENGDVDVTVERDAVERFVELWTDLERGAGGGG